MNSNIYVVSILFFFHPEYHGSHFIKIIITSIFYTSCPVINPPCYMYCSPNTRSYRCQHFMCIFGEMCDKESCSISLVAYAQVKGCYASQTSSGAARLPISRTSSKPTCFMCRPFYHPPHPYLLSFLVLFLCIIFQKQL